MQSRGGGGSIDISLPNLNIDARSGRVDIAMPRPLYTRERDLVSFLHKGEWAPEPLWPGMDRRIPLASTGVRNSGRSTRSHSLYRLSYPGPLDYQVCCRMSHTALTYSRLTLRRLMSYIYGAPILDVSRSHTTTQHSR